MTESYLHAQCLTEISQKSKHTLQTFVKISIFQTHILAVLKHVKVPNAKMNQHSTWQPLDVCSMSRDHATMLVIFEVGQGLGK